MSRGHAHDTTSLATSAVMTALVLIAAFMVFEVVAAVWGSSLALFADAGHLLSDVAALAMSAWAIRLAKRPAEGRWTFGLRRAEIVSAAVNGVTLVAVALLILVEALQRLIRPVPVRGTLLIVVALVGAVVNITATTALSRTDRSNLNVRGAYLHVVTDLYAFGATAVAGVIIDVTSWQRADAVASLLIVLLMARASWGLLRDAGKILLQASPDDIDLAEVRAHLVNVEHVRDVHDLHAWTIASNLPTMSAHVVIDDDCFSAGDAPRILDALQRCLGDHFAVGHATFQLEPASHVGHEEGLHP